MSKDPAKSFMRLVILAALTKMAFMLVGDMRNEWDKAAQPKLPRN